MKYLQEINRYGRPKVWVKYHLPVWGHCVRHTVWSYERGLEPKDLTWTWAGVCWDCMTPELRKRYGLTRLETTEHTLGGFPIRLSPDLAPEEYKFGDFGWKEVKVK